MKTATHLFQYDNEHAEMPEGMRERVYECIEAAAVREARSQKKIWGVFFVVSLTAFIGTGIYAVHAFAQSNFGSYFSLIFSDPASVSLWWRELGLSLIESLPIFGIALFLASVSLALWSLHKFAKKTPGMFINGGARVA